jgi:hypothetical protein
MFGGAVTQDLKIGDVNALGGKAGHLDYNTTLENTNLSVKDLNAHGLTSKDVSYNMGVGNAGIGGKADQLDALNLNVGSIDAHSSNYGLTGNGSVNNANLDILNVKGGHAGLSMDGKEVLGASGDYNARAGVENASANYDLTQGTASASVKNAQMGAQLSNASLNLFGNNVALPDAGYKVNANADANLDVLNGKAGAHGSLAGSSVNFAGKELTLGDWAQAGADVDLGKGAVKANLGGDKGVGVDASIADANLDLNVGGYKIDVDQGIRDAGSAIASGASYVGNKISSGASAAWDAVTSW